MSGSFTYGKNCLQRVLRYREGHQDLGYFLVLSNQTKRNSFPNKKMIELAKQSATNSTLQVKHIISAIAGPTYFDDALSQDFLHSIIDNDILTCGVINFTGR